MEPAPQDLRTLAICHYIYAGVTAFGGLAIMAVMFMFGAFGQMAARDGSEPPPAVFFGMMVAVLGAVLIFVLGYAIATAYTGYFLTRRRHYLFCMILSGLHCASVPFGTILG